MLRFSRLSTDFNKLFSQLISYWSAALLCLAAGGGAAPARGRVCGESHRRAEPLRAAAARRRAVSRAVQRVRAGTAAGRVRATIPPAQQRSLHTHPGPFTTHIV